jgi:hypothetical protein
MIEFDACLPGVEPFSNLFISILQSSQLDFRTFMALSDEGLQTYISLPNQKCVALAIVNGCQIFD